MIRKGLILLCILLAAALLIGCANDEQPEATATPAPVELPVPTLPPTPEPPPSCACAVPEGMTAPYDTAVPERTNSRTPSDTLVVGVPPMRGDFVQGWGTNQYDAAVKELTGGYKDTYHVLDDGQIRLNESVVCRVRAEYDEDWNKTYSFTLHSYNKWSNGEPITARDYVAGILAYASPEFARSGGVSTVGEGIVGFEEYRRGVVSDENEGGEPSPYLAGVRLVDDANFTVTLSAGHVPYFWEPALLTFRPVYMAGWFPGAEVISDADGVRFDRDITEDIVRAAETERFAPTVTCGPYRLASFDGTTVTLSRNEHFTVCADGYVPYFEYIELRHVPSAEAFRMLANGEIDFLPDANFEDWAAMQGEQPIPPTAPTDPTAPTAPTAPTDPAAPGSSGAGDSDPDATQPPPSDGSADPNDPDAPPPETPAPAVNFVELNSYLRAGFAFVEFALDFGPTQDYNVRLAISHLLDRNAIINNALGGQGVVVSGDYSPAQWTHRWRYRELMEQLEQINHSLSRANERLDASEWVFEQDGETPFDIDNVTESGEYLRHNADGEPLQVIIASASENVSAAMRAAIMEARLVGVEVVVETISMRVLLDHYHNAKSWDEEERKYHAFQLATDFTPVDDKFWTVHSSLAESPLNSNGIQDERLDEIVLAMRSLEPGQPDLHADLWVEYQVRLQELLPMFPLYANRYFDAYNNIITQAPTTAFAPYHSIITHIAKH